MTWTPSTPRGVQCPTAPVQQVTEVIYVRNCCGKLVPTTTVRKPKEGEAEFKQCLCAEKKSAEKQDEAKTAEPRPLLAFDVRQANVGGLGTFIAIDPAPIERPLKRGPTDPPYSPSTPPPQAI